MLQLDYTATDAVTEVLTSHESHLQEIGVSIDQWDPAKPPSGALINADLLVCNCSLNTFKNPAEVLSNMAATVKEGGFVLLHTLLKGETLGEIVRFLTNPDLQKKPSILSQVELNANSLVFLLSQIGHGFDLRVFVAGGFPPNKHSFLL